MSFAGGWAKGGAGGRSNGVGNSGGAGGIASGTTAAASGNDVHVRATQYGGHGGHGYGGATGGAGAASSLTNAVSGSASGYLLLRQVAAGGSGGYSTTSSGGAGGAATSNLSFTTTGAADSVTAMAGAHGGGGGSGSGKAAGAGGDATATLVLTGVAGVVGTASAAGGNGGSISSTQPAIGGAASATASVMATGTGLDGTATATAGATGGYSSKQSSANATAFATTAAGQQAHATAAASGASGIAQANAAIDTRKRFVTPTVLSRHRGDFPKVDPAQVDYMDISPKQLVSVAAALIPFLEHDDANRALMGSNMQRQAVPLLRTDAPLVGTGLEHVVAKNAGTVVRAERGGVVEYSDSETIRIKVSKRDDKSGNPFRSEEDEYTLKKYVRSNQNTCINQRPIVRKGDRVEAGDIIADGPATDNGELALGQNVLVAFLPWEGYNFEDAIILSEDLVKEDSFTSIHVQVYDIEARDTKLGPEEITRDIPNVSEESLRHLDETGIARIGSKVKPGDILVGKVTPKGETELAPEEKLLRAIFGEKAEDVRDASLTASPGTDGVVVDVRVSSRRDKVGESAKSSVTTEVNKIKKLYTDRIIEVRATFVNLLKDEMLGLPVLEDVVDHKTGELVLEKGKRIKVAHLDKADYGVLSRLVIEDKKVQQKFSRLVNMAAMEEAKLIAYRDSKIDNLRKGDDLPPGVIKLVKVFVATKRRMSVGDKMAGRHGNKGVVAKVVPVEDMPYLPDGTPVQIILNPLGVPSRMNVGQLLETHLGWAAKALGMKVASPVFNGATESLITEYLRKAGLPETGKIQLRDGRSGRPMDQEVCVGQIYMLKLNHLVDDKIHARAIGPYSLVTQQPLGGKAQFGGQRFGEMEVWALKAYGAAYTLQELLTIKSDDIQGRTKAYESIVKGEREVEPGTPESFNVLMREMQSLCLDVVKLVKVEGVLDAGEEEEEVVEE